jgi:Sulfatase-modifying factor enzyme 1
VSEQAQFEVAGALLAEQFVARLREERAARPGRSALFPKLGDAAMRRQVVRWIGSEYRAATPGILEVLRAALDDADWEVRASAMLVTVRLRAAELRSALKEVVLPSAHQLGLDLRDARLLLAIREIGVEALDAAGEADPVAAVERRLAGVPHELVRLVLVHEPARRDRDWLLLHALAAPLTLAQPLPEPLPAGIIVRERHALLADALFMTWVSPVPHILGDDRPDAAVVNPIREHVPAGFFIARRPLSAEAIERLGVRAPARRVPRAEAIAARLARTPDAPLVVSRDEALALCEAIAHRTGAAVEPPSADELECAARGTDGRRYPWGNGLQRLVGGDRGPHGMERFAVPVAQWSGSHDPSGVPLVLGGPASLRCGERSHGIDLYAVRPVVRAVLAREGTSRS